MLCTSQRREQRHAACYGIEQARSRRVGSPLEDVQQQQDTFTLLLLAHLHCPYFIEKIRKTLFSFFLLFSFYSITRVPMTLDVGSIPAFDVPVRVFPSMVTSNVRFNRIGLVIDCFHRSRLPSRIGSISGMFSPDPLAIPSTTPPTSVSSRTTACIPMGVEILTFQVPVIDMKILSFIA